MLRLIAVFTDRRKYDSKVICQQAKLYCLKTGNPGGLITSKPVARRMQVICSRSVHCGVPQVQAIRQHGLADPRRSAAHDATATALSRCASPAFVLPIPPF